MYVEFKKLRFKNILSYGNAFTEIDFKKGVNLIHAANGSGKSTILDAMTFCLFGKPYRDIRLAKLVNSTNAKDMITELEFKINRDTYSITRGLKPALFKIVKNGSELDLLSSKKLNQDEIDKLIGINLRLFKNIVGIAVTNNKPFLSLPIGEKRALMENIFNIDVIGEMCKDVKKRRSVAIAEQSVKTAELKGINDGIADNERYLENMRGYISSFNDNREAELERIRSRIDETQAKLLKSENNVSKGTLMLERKQSELGQAPDPEEYGRISRELGTAEADKARLSKTVNGLANRSECPICGSPLNEGHAKRHIDELNSELSRIAELLPRLEKELADYGKSDEEYRRKVDFIETVRTKTEEEKRVVENLRMSLEGLNESYEAEQTKTCGISLAEYEEKLAGLRKSLETATCELEKLEHSILVDGELVSMLGDSGVKQYFFRKLIRLLNKNVNEYLAKFEMPIQMTFDEQMQETITRGKVDMDYNQFSGGERSRIDMAILLSFFNVSRIISNWSCGLLFMDEILDSGVDQGGIDQFLATLYNMVQTERKPLGVYLVSHKLVEPKIQINSTINISRKPGGFSTMEIK